MACLAIAFLQRRRFLEGQAFVHSDSSIHRCIGSFNPTALIPNRRNGYSDNDEPIWIR